MNHNLRIYDKKYLIEHVPEGLYSGDINVNPPAIEKPPVIKWNGAPIDRHTFRVALAFLKHTHDVHQCEGQARFWYNPETFEWRAVALPQEKHGAAHTREVEKESDIKEAIMVKLMEDGFGEAGTIHHHSGMGAFQSGGDKTDELSRSGFHVTVGQMGSKVADFHARATFKGINYEQEKGMVNVADWLPGLRTKNDGGKHAPLNKEIAHFWCSLEDLPEYPKVWESYVVEPEVPTYQAPTNNWNQYNGYGGHYGAHHGGHYGEHYRGRVAGAVRNPSASAKNKEVHKHDIPVYEDKTYIVWLRRYTPRFRINVRLPKAQRDAIEASTQEENTLHLINETSGEAVEHSVPESTGTLFTAQEIRIINQMSTKDCEEYIDQLRDEDRLGESGDMERVEERLKDKLAHLRSTYMGDNITAGWLEYAFEELGHFSSKLIHTVDQFDVSDTDEDGLESGMTSRELVLTWASLLVSALYDMDQREWDEISLNSNHDMGLYKLMCNGLTEQADACFLEDIYDEDGTVLEIFRRDPDIEKEDLLIAKEEFLDTEEY